MSESDDKREFDRLRAELAEAKAKIALLESQLDDRNIIEHKVKAMGQDWYNQLLKERETSGIRKPRGLPIQSNMIDELEPYLTDEARCETASSGLITTTNDILERWNERYGSDCGLAIFLIAQLLEGEVGIQQAALEAVSKGFDDLEKMGLADPSELGRFVSPSLCLKAVAFQSSVTRALMHSDEIMRRLQKTSAIKLQWSTLIKCCAAGDYSGASHLAFFHKPNALPLLGGATFWPSIHINKEGKRFWCLLRHAPVLPATSPLIQCWAVRDTTMLKNAPMSMVLVSETDGLLIWQNPASTSLMGCHSLENSQQSPGDRGKKPMGLNYLSMIFESHQDLRDEMLAVVKLGEQWSQRIEIKSAALRKMLGCAHTQSVWHRISISRGQLQDPFTLGPTLCIIQVDETKAHLAEMSLKVAQSQREALLTQILPKQVTDVLLTRLQADQANQISIGNRAPEVQEDHAEEESDDSTSGPLPLSRFRSRSILSSDLAALTRQNLEDLATSHDEVSILFADIKDFTRICSLLAPAQVMLMLNDLFTSFDHLLDDYDVYKIETIGDCYVCAAGLFDRQGADGTGVGGQGRGGRSKEGGWGKLGGMDPHHAHKCVAFALALSEAASLLDSPLGGKIEIRIGIHSGPCHSGVVGRKMPRFCLFGDTINTASRMESTGEAGRIHVSESTASLIPDVPWEEKVMQVKGKGEMKTYFYPIEVGNLAIQTLSI